MIIDFTTGELNQLRALEAGYKKLLDDLEEEILRLRPDDPEPDDEEYRRIQSMRPEAPPMPEPVEIVDGTPVYNKADLDAYHASPEYKAFAAENERINGLITKQWDDWYAAGSDEWKAARKKAETLEAELVQARTDLYRKAEDRYFYALGSAPSGILEDGYRQVDRYIIARYNEYDHMRGESDFKAADVRVLDDGRFRLDTTETKANLLRVLERHLKTLPPQEREDLLAYVDRTLSTSPFVSSDGKLWGMVKKSEQRTEQTEEKGLTTVRPKEYKRPNTKPHNMIFDGELTTTDRNYFEPLGMNRQKNVIMYANFVPPKAVEALGLDAYDERVYAAVGSCLFAGNNFIPFSMLYNRGILGLSPSQRGKDITQNIEQDIINSLAMFDGRVTITNDPTGELAKADPNFKKVTINEPLLFYQIREEKVHGQITRGIAIPSGYVPVGYRYAEMNRNEIQTDRIESIHVDGLNYSRDNVIIANATYTRVKEIQYKNDRPGNKKELPENLRTITYAAIADKVNLDFRKLSPTERNRLKKKIDACMKSYQANGLIAGYEHKKDSSKSFYAVVIRFPRQARYLT